MEMFDTSNAIKTADGALSALHLGKKIKTNEQKESTKGDVMQKILENKLRSATQSTIFVEPSFNNEWGSRPDRNGA